LVSASEQLRLHPDALVRNALGVRLGFSNQRRQALAQIGSGRLVEAVVDLAGVKRCGLAATATVFRKEREVVKGASGGSKITPRAPPLAG